MTDLTEFLLARIAEDQAVAERAFEYGSREWHLGEFGEEVLWWPPEPHVAETERRHGMRVVSDQWRGETIGSDGKSKAPHIVRWDPARVLAECEAKRQIVEEHLPTKPPWPSRMERGCLVCGTAQSWDSQASEANCKTLRSLAMPYADHPDYNPDWRPR
jgi:hypothetical protein